MKSWQNIGVRDQCRLGGWGQLPEYFLHGLPENQVVLPEYYMLLCPKNGHSKNSRLQPPPPPHASYSYVTELLLIYIKFR